MTLEMVPLARQQKALVIKFVCWGEISCVKFRSQRFLSVSPFGSSCVVLSNRRSLRRCFGRSQMKLSPFTSEIGGAVRFARRPIWEFCGEMTEPMTNDKYTGKAALKTPTRRLWPSTVWSSDSCGKNNRVANTLTSMVCHPCRRNPWRRRGLQVELQL